MKQNITAQRNTVGHKKGFNETTYNSSPKGMEEAWQSANCTEDMYTTSVKQSIFPLRNRFYSSFIIIINIETSKGLAMISGTAMPPWLTVSPSYNTQASTKALMV